MRDVILRFMIITSDLNIDPSYFYVNFYHAFTYFSLLKSHKQADLSPHRVSPTPNNKEREAGYSRPAPRSFLVRIKFADQLLSLAPFRDTTAAAV